MRHPASTIAALLALVLLALAAISCGDGSDPGSSAEPSAAPQGENADAAAKRRGDEGREDRPGSKPNEGVSPPERSVSSHDDSGGGVAQFRVRGGDNSVQNFGSEGSGADFDAAAAALHGFLDARAAGDWATACEHVSGEIAASLRRLATQAQQGGKDCAHSMEALSGGVSATIRREAAVADIGALRVEGERAFLLYHGARDIDYAIPMANESGEWKVASLAGIPLN